MAKFLAPTLLKVRKQGEDAFALSECTPANTFWTRFLGLMSRKNLRPEEGLLIEGCNQIHMFFMKFSIDALFLDKQGQIVAVESLKPWRVSKVYFKAANVLEVPAGSVAKWGWKKGDRLEFLGEQDRESRS